MKPAIFDYHRPQTLAEAIGLLSSSEFPKVLAGGQSMMPMMNMRFLQPATVIDINDLDLDYIRRDGNVLRIGAMTRQRRIERSGTVKECAPLLVEVLGHVGHVQTRNRGTIGGSLGHLDPAAELPAACMTLEAEIVVSGPSGARVIPMSAFPLAYMIPAIEPDELVTEVRVPVRAAGDGYGFREFARRHGDFAIAAVAAHLSLRDGRVARAAITVAGLAPVPTRVPEAEALLTGAQADALEIERAAQFCGEIEAVDSVHATAAYARHLAAVMASRAIGAAVLDAQAGGVA